MFVMKKVGRRISELRKQKNMTQLELADKMGVSFQAVSNWERGNSMPDISKLPELAEIFGTTIDDILGAKSALIEKAAEGNLEEYVENNPISLEEIKEAAPILKPSQMVVIADKNVKVVAKGASGSLTINGRTYDLGKSGSVVVSEDNSADNDSGFQGDSEVKEAAVQNETKALEEAEPSDTSTDTEETAEVCTQNDSVAADGKNSIFGSDTDLDDFIELLPYLDDEAAAKLMKKLAAGGKDISSLIPHMDEDAVGMVAMEIYESKGFGAIEEYCQYMDEDVLGRIALKEVEKYGLARIVSIVDYLDEDIVDEIARRAGSVQAIIQIADYVSEDVLEEIALKDAQDNGALHILPILDYLDEDVIGKIAEIEAVKNGISAIIPMMDYMDEDDLGRIVLKHFENGGIGDIQPFINYLDEDDIGKIAAIESQRNGLAGIIPLLNYMDEDDLGRIVFKHCERNGIEGIEPFLDRIDEDVVAEIAIMTIKKQGLKAAKPLLPYVDEDVISEFIKKML